MLKHKVATWSLALLAAVGALGAAGAMAADAPAPVPVLARLANGETITEKDLSQYLDRRIDLRPAVRNTWGVETVLKEMAFTRTLTLEGQAMGEPRRGEGQAERFDDVYSLNIFKKLAPRCEPPADEAATRRFYEQNPKAFTVPPTARLSRIMLPRTERVDGEAAVGWLLAQIQAVGTGAAKFDDVAARAEQVYKLDPQGDLGWVALGEDNTILRALADAKQGDIVGPVHEGDFVYIFQVNARRDARLLPWDEVSATAAKRAVRYCQEQGLNNMRASMFKKYGVETDAAAIRELFSAARAGKAGK